MHLSSGTRLGPYEIVAPIGAGGMGEVYRARDTRLNRDVAVKILSSAFAADSDRMARFAREARILALLNHPDIAAIYGMEDRAIILELVEGPTLAARLRHGPIPWGEAAPIIDQLVEALGYAHEKGVVHRDLKPANLKVTSEGRLKVLDFGLAKALAGATVVADPASSSTATMPATESGVIMGTPGYMAPEQARGQDADKRADIWAFGVVVYEILTGRRLFAGPTASDVLAAVLRQQSDFNAVPPRMRKLLQACLAKDPRDRMRDIGDARFLMGAAQTPIGPAPMRAFRGALAWALLGVVLLAAGLGLGLFRATNPPPAPMLSFSVDLGPDALAGRDTAAAISPDGTRIVFRAKTADGKTGLAVRLLDESAHFPLSGTEGAINPFFSPDGQWVGFFAEGKLRKISVHGGAAIPLCDIMGNERGGSWGQDGYIVVAPGSLSGLFRVPEGGGTPQPLTKLADRGERTHRYPQVLPGARAVLFTAHTRAANFDDANVDVLSLKTGQRKTVQRGGYFGRYLLSGHLVYLRGSTLFAVPFDPDKLETNGTPVPVMEDIAANLDFGGGQIDFSRNGTGFS